LKIINCYDTEIITTSAKSFILQANGILIAMPYSWLARWLEGRIDKKLNVVILPVKVVQYCRQPLGGLKRKKRGSVNVVIPGA
jgi:hypothetical protein